MNNFDTRRMDQRASGDADQAEFSAIINRSSIVDAGTFDDRVAGALDDFDPGESSSMESWQRADLINDTSVGSIQVEIERRKDLLGTAYPFQLNENNLTYVPSNTGYYEFCLAICLAKSITAGAYAQLPRHFERTSGNLVALYFGDDCSCFHTGWPRDGETGARFKTAMQKLYELSGEWFWNPSEGLPDDPEPATVKDEGVDFVVWKRALDSRLGSLFILGQCACGNDWDEKLTELHLPRVRKWFHPGCFVDAVRSFMTPLILSDGNFREALVRAGLVFDRVRLTLIAEQRGTVPSIQAMRSSLADLAALVLT